MFANAILNQEARTENGMKARKGSANSCVDLFYSSGSSRGKDISNLFSAALAENEDIALRILLWTRDIRGGSGERQTFRDLLLKLTSLSGNSEKTLRIIAKTPEVGRWDDLLIFEKNSKEENVAFQLISEALKSGNGLCAKWMPRKGEIAERLRKYLQLTPKAYRKTLVNLTKVVENKMCKNEWSDINYEHVPSVASARYKKAFERHDETGFHEFHRQVASGEKKVNANAIFPHDVLANVQIDSGYYYNWNADLSEAESLAIQNQWNALPNYIPENASIIPLVDVSGSMQCGIGGSHKAGNTTCLKVAVSLGLYCADKNKGPFEGCFLTFSEESELIKLQGNVIQKVTQMTKSKWGMNTNLHKAFEKILKVAKNGSVPQEHMPKILLILSDMQFDNCVIFDDSALQMIQRKYAEAGYEVPKIVFWNLNAAYGNCPVSSKENGTALVSGFSPSLLTSVLKSDLSKFTPESIMMETIMKDRYSY